MEICEGAELSLPAGKAAAELIQINDQMIDLVNRRERRTKRSRR
jgi:hypothetical protein